MPRASKRGRFAKRRDDVYIMVRYRDKIWQTDFYGTDMCNSEVRRMDREEVRGIYCDGCKKIECVRNNKDDSTTSLWRKIQTINPRIGSGVGVYVGR